MSGSDTSILFLRGINVGAHNRLKVKDFAARLSEVLSAPVLNHLQSGNLVVASGDGAVVREQAARLLAEEFALEVPLIIRDAAALAALAAADPWPETEAVRVHLSMWEEPHDPALADAMTAADWAGNEIVFVGSNAWMRFAKDSRAAKLGNHVIERRLKVAATARNADTIRALVGLAEGLEGDRG